MVRPEIFSFFFIVVFLYILMDARDNPNSNRLFWLIPLQVIWANMHLYFGVGVLLTAGMLAEQLVLHRKNIRSTVLIRKMAIVLLCIILASFMTPFGMSGAVFALKVNVLKDFPVSIAENESIAVYFRTTAPWQDIPLSLFRPMVVVLAISFLFGFRKQEKPWFYACAAVGTAIIGLALVRATPFFAIMFLPALSSNLDDVWQYPRSRATASWRRLGVAAFILLIAALIVMQYAGVFSEHRQFGIGLVPQSNAAADFFKANNLRGPIFNDDDIGSYLIFHLYPAERVFVDNRFGDAYSAEFFRTRYLAPLKSDEAWKSLAEKYQFNALFFYHYDANPDARAFLYRRMRDPSWALVYADRFSVILLRNVPQNKPVIDAFHITRENAALRLAFLSDSSNHDEQVAAGDLFNFIGRADLAHDAFSRVLVYSPNDGRVLRIMGEMESGIGDPVNMNLAKVHLERAIEVGEKTAEAYASLSYVYYMLGSFEKAEDAARSALRVNPENTEAIQGLELLLKRKSLQ
jgi:tetratricopeptide (TPR) repeat protein